MGPLIFIISLGLLSLGGLFVLLFFERQNNKKWAKACVERAVNPK
jgi:hypothetical protein